MVCPHPFTKMRMVVMVCICRVTSLTRVKIIYLGWGGCTNFCFTLRIESGTCEYTQVFLSSFFFCSFSKNVWYLVSPHFLAGDVFYVTVCCALSNLAISLIFSSSQLDKTQLNRLLSIVLNKKWYLWCVSLSCLWISWCRHSPHICNVTSAGVAHDSRMQTQRSYYCI